MSAAASDWQVRQAQVADAPAIARINIHAWQTAYRGILPDAYLDALSIEERIPRWEERLASLPVDQRAWVTHDDSGTIAGYCVTGPYRSAHSELGPRIRNAAEVFAIYVHPDHWDSGAGRIVFEHGIEALRAHRYRSAVLWMLEGNQRAGRFYERRGWHLDGGRKNEPFTEDGSVRADEVRYRLELT